MPQFEFPSLHLWQLRKEELTQGPALRKDLNKFVSYSPLRKIPLWASFYREQLKVTVHWATPASVAQTEVCGAWDPGPDRRVDPVSTGSWVAVLRLSGTSQPTAARAAGDAEKRPHIPRSRPACSPRYWGSEVPAEPLRTEERGPPPSRAREHRQLHHGCVDTPPMAVFSAQT